MHGLTGYGQEDKCIKNMMQVTEEDGESSFPVMHARVQLVEWTYVYYASTIEPYMDSAVFA